MNPLVIKTVIRIGITLAGSLMMLQANRKLRKENEALKARMAIRSLVAVPK